jgi:hypothetical protein
MSWSFDVGPVVVLGTRPGPPPKPDAPGPLAPPGHHQHRRSRRPAVIARPQAAAASIAALLNPPAPRRAYRRYWV